MALSCPLATLYPRISTLACRMVRTMGARNQAIAARTPDRAEGVAAFLEKWPPRFTGPAHA
jgi:hypothetical protein